MRKSLSLLVCLLALSSSASSQDDSGATTNPAAAGWKLSADANLSATQAMYSDNWTGGELGSLSWTFTSNSTAEKRLSAKLSASTTLKLSFGQTYTQTRLADGSAHWRRPEKSTDLIDLESVLRFTLNGMVDPYFAGRFETQFFDGSVPRVKRYLSPAKITESAGLLRVFADDEKKLSLKSRFGLALRQIVNTVIVDTVVGTTSRVTTNDGGLESVTDLKAALSEKIGYTSKLTLYKALYFSESDTSSNDYWKAVDVNWEHILTAQVAKYLQTSLYFQLLYDKGIDKRARIKQTLGLGLAVKVL